MLHDDDNQVKLEASSFGAGFVLPYERETTSLRELQTICIKQAAVEAGNAMATRRVMSRLEIAHNSDVATIARLDVRRSRERAATTVKALPSFSPCVVSG